MKKVLAVLISLFLSAPGGTAPSVILSAVHYKLAPRTSIPEGYFLPDPDKLERAVELLRFHLAYLEASENEGFDVNLGNDRRVARLIPGVHLKINEGRAEAISHHLMFLNTMGFENLKSLLRLLENALAKKEGIPRDWTIPQRVEVFRFCLSMNFVEGERPGLISRLKVSPFIDDPILAPSREEIFATDRFSEMESKAFVVEGEEAERIAQKIFPANYSQEMRALDEMTQESEAFILSQEEKIRKAEEAGNHEISFLSREGARRTYSVEQVKQSLPISRQQNLSLKLSRNPGAKRRKVIWLNLAGLNGPRLGPYGAYVSQATWNMARFLDVISENKIYETAIKEALDLFSILPSEEEKNLRLHRRIASRALVTADRALFSAKPEMFRLLLEAFPMTSDLETTKNLFSLLKRSNPRWFDQVVNRLSLNPSEEEFKSAVYFLLHFGWMEDKVAKRIEAWMESEKEPQPARKPKRAFTRLEMEKMQQLLRSRTIVTQETMRMGMEELAALRRSVEADMRRVPFEQKKYDPRRTLFLSVLKEKVFCEGGPTDAASHLLSCLSIDNFRGQTAAHISSEDYLRGFADALFRSQFQELWVRYVRLDRLENPSAFLNLSANIFVELGRLMERRPTPQLLAFTLLYLGGFNSAMVRRTFDNILKCLLQFIEEKARKDLHSYWNVWDRQEEVQFIERVLGTSDDLTEILPAPADWLDPVAKKWRRAIDQEIEAWCRFNAAAESAL